MTTEILMAREQAEIIAKEIWGKQGFAEECYTATGKLYKRRVGYRRKRKTKRILTTEKGASYEPDLSYEEAFYEVNQRIGLRYRTNTHRDRVREVLTKYNMFPPQLRNIKSTT